VGNLVDISADQAQAALAEGALLIDIRRPDEVRDLTAENAQVTPRDMLEIELERDGVAGDQTILLMCQSGLRSRYAAKALRHLGWPNAYSVTGGFSQWLGDKRPLKTVAFLDDASRKRYARHLSLPEIGIEGQAKLKKARVAMIGAGGLGAPAALYLAAMGVGFIRLIDDDVVELSNLQRQVIHAETTLGDAKVASAAQRIAELNSDIEVEAIARRFDGQCGDLLEDVDLVINGADNFAARYTLNDMCLELGKPLVDGAVLEMEGQVSVFCHPDGGPCYRCLYPEVPPSDLAPSCVAAGVLGVVPGTIGVLQALEAAKLLAGFGEPLVGRLLTFDATTSAFSEVSFAQESHCTCQRRKAA
jgi:molybdopterin/thiamine biosynthesis adenylyltransferase/rhodanese-related sulfurtransferase